jgi:hypothetical protein
MGTEGTEEDGGGAVRAASFPPRGCHISGDEMMFMRSWIIKADEQVVMSFEETHGRLAPEPANQALQRKNKGSGRCSPRSLF